MKEIHISLPAEVITRIGILPITNTLVVTLLVTLFLCLFSLFIYKKISWRPGKLQTLIEILLFGLFSFFGNILGKDTKRFFPLLATFFIFILVSNWTEVLPGAHSISIQVAEHGHEKAVSLLRAPTTDLNTTFALALIAVIFLQLSGLKALGFQYFTKFINFKSPIDFFLGLLEAISEFSKTLSFAFRLFGNIFAGQVLLTVIAFLIPVIAPLPFLGLEIFVGLIQALVFSMLTAVFLSVATSHH